MPTKRRAVIEDDDDSAVPGPSSTAHKRQRIDDEEERPRRSRKGKAKAVDEEDMAEEQEENDDEDDVDAAREDENQEELDKLFEETHYDQIMAAVKSRDRYRGTISECGIIEKVELHQFMCHQRLSFSFGPQINFIIGHNGSGKSAVLSAITIALGGKTISTGRGSGLKSFIREGQNAAEVSIQLKNKGSEAFKPKDFGDSIIITRRFTVEGSSIWKIKSKDGRVISTKREELSKICDHMNIQVDNPMTVLTQDASRVFLSSSNPNERYNLFLKGTQLQQLSDEYSITLENIQATTKVLEQKKGAIPDLRTAYEVAKGRFEEAELARKQKAKMDDLKKELAWAHVKGKENELSEKLREVAGLENKLPKIQTEIETEQAKLEGITENFTVAERELELLGDVNDLEKRKVEVNGQLKVGKKKLSELSRDIKNMNTSIEALKESIAQYDARIKQETERLEKNAQGKRERIQQALAGVQVHITGHEMTLETMRAQKQELSDKMAHAEQEGKKLEVKRDEMNKQIETHKRMITNLEQAEKDSLLPYGRNIKGVLEQINKTTWYGNKPLGPLGAYVKAKDANTWGDILRNQLRQYLTAFAITDPRDRNQLKNILMQSQNAHVQVVISSTELFDYSNGEPPARYLTILRALEITDQLVVRILINNANIEARVLAKTRREAQQMLEQLPKGGTAYTLDQFIVRVFPDGISSIPLDIRKNNDSSNLMLTGRDTVDGKRRAQQEIESLRRKLSDMENTYGGFRKEFMECKRQLMILEESEKTTKSALRARQTELQTLKQEMDEEMPMNINSFVDARKEAEDEIQSIKAQFEPVAREKTQMDILQEQLLSELGKVRKQIGAFEERRSELKRNLENVAETRIKAQANVQYYEKRQREAQKKVDEAKAVAEVLQQEFVTWTEKATEYCERVENPRPVAEVEKSLKSVQNALKEREKRQGATVDELEEQMLRTQEQYLSARANIRAMVQLIKKLKQSLIVRYARWEDFRRHIALRTKVVFQYHLSQRGYFGKLLFNHQSKILVLKVQTDDQASQQGHNEKDPRSLSGGEKSFSTICLLLALWESIGCPIRCLDEFDVFMDAVNRRISMRMMIDTANASNQKQYVLITPLEMANISFGNTVRVHKMSDPQRNQGTLAF